ncbi:MAG: serine kinase [Rikenellaceae bacterium]|jgi:serine kinase of HPr protein (carbohydrate metabolism regulator)|nr:serine kinase [Rikenellaceae bacterium]
MTVKELAEKLGLRFFTGQAGLDRPVTGGYTSDLLSDVIGHSQEGQVWITLQTHRNIVGVASLKDLSAIVLVKGFTPDGETIELAETEGIALLGTSEQAFEMSGQLYQLIRA